jgi:hypothetical protein
MFIPGPDLDFFVRPGSQIQKQQQKRGVKKKLLSYLFCSHKYGKIENYFIFELVKKKIWSNLQRTFYPKIVNKLSKDRFGIRDQGSEIRNTAGKYQFGRISLFTAEFVVMKNKDFNTQQVFGNCYQQLAAFVPSYGQFLSTPCFYIDWTSKS